MPLTAKGRKIMAAMKRKYGARGEEVFYRSRNAGRITGVERGGSRVLRHAVRRMRERRASKGY